MNKEQEEIISAFKSTYDPQRKKPLVIYGTGINAEAVLTCCREYPIAGVVDIAKTGERFFGFSVMPLEEVAERKLNEIVVVARPSVHSIIY